MSAEHSTEIVLPPRHVAVHENVLARINVILAMAHAEGFIDALDFESLIGQLDTARRDSERARGVDMDAAPGGEQA